MSSTHDATNKWFEELTLARNYQAEVEQMRVDARLRLRHAVLTAHKSGGLGVTQIARHLNITRQGVYDILEAARKDFPSRPELAYKQH